MRKELAVIDADGHVLEPPDMWVDYIDPKFREKAPRLIKTGAGEKFYFCDEFTLGDGSKNLGGAGAIGARDGETGFSQYDAGGIPPYFEGGRRGGFDPHARMPDMDKEGIDAAFLYPTMGLFTDLVEDEAQASANARAYNRWLADYCSAYPDRLFGVTMLPMQSVEGAIAELKYCAREFGFKSAFVRPNPYNGRPLHHKDFYPIWEVAQDMDIAIGVHGAAAQPNLGEDRFPMAEGHAVEHCVVHTFEMMAAAASFIMCGVCEAFPRLRVGFLEAGGGWMMGWLQRMDRHVDDLGLNDTNLTCSPTEIFQRQCFVAFEPTETSLAYLAEPLGPNRILFSSDYPHPDGFWGAAKMIKRMKLKPEVEAAVLGGGAKNFYRLN
jgi:predicted TIM-barrel fold metal-dependent hydrolase